MQGRGPYTSRGEGEDYRHPVPQPPLTVPPNDWAGHMIGYTGYLVRGSHFIERTIQGKGTYVHPLDGNVPEAEARRVCTSCIHMLMALGKWAYASDSTPPLHAYHVFKDGKLDCPVAHAKVKEAATLSGAEGFVKAQPGLSFFS